MSGSGIVVRLKMLLRSVGRLSLCGPLLAGGAAAYAQKSDLGVVAARPMPPAEQERWVPARSSKSACIDMGRIAGAMVVDHRNVDIIMRGGRRFRLTMAQACPQLGYYGGFYYRPTHNGKLCAGADRVMARAGGSCRVHRISQLNKAPPRKRQ